jgi:hypothetical protein
MSKAEHADLCGLDMRPSRTETDHGLDGERVAGLHCTNRLVFLRRDRDTGGALSEAAVDRHKTQPMTAVSSKTYCCSEGR